MHPGGDVRIDVDELVRSAQEGDAASFAALYEHFSDAIYRYVSFKTGSPGDAEDITAEVFVKMLESIRSFKPRGHPFSSWLYRIAHNLVVDHFRSKSRKKTVPIEASENTVGATAFDLDEYVDLKLTMRHVHKAMEVLTSLQKEVISLRFAAGLSLAETASAVGKKENAVKALQHAGVVKLRRALTPEATLTFAAEQQGTQ
jgi:RNA polymerase sigma-70 factor (ECF subfamily)